MNYDYALIMFGRGRQCRNHEFRTHGAETTTAIAGATLPTTNESY